MPVRVCTSMTDTGTSHSVSLAPGLQLDAPGDHHFIEISSPDVVPTPLHRHEFYEIAIMRSGRMALTGRESDVLLERGDVLVFAPEAVHGYEPHGATCWTDLYLLPELMLDDLRLLWQVTGLVRRLLAHALFGTPLGDGVIRLRAVPGEMEDIEAELVCMERASKAADPCLATINGCFLKLLGLFNNAYLREFSGDDLPIRPEMWEAVNQMELMLRLGTPFEPVALAGILGMSTQGLERMFHKHTGAGPSEYYQKRRVGRARQMLSVPGTGITEVAYELGFSDGAHFSKVFKRFTGCTPREYRDKQASQGLKSGMRP
jgi:AraC family transcriptional regulator, L-rhamnose operon regulatory protein RhaS